MFPQSVEYICENCSTNIDDNWWWCPVCGNNVSLKEVYHYSKLQRLIITLQDLFSCTSETDTVHNTETETQVDLFENT
jgi:DNA-directed RNA polymerase subunit RPC12/RpoP